jgi:hypothetical protein
MKQQIKDFMMKQTWVFFMHLGFKKALVWLFQKEQLFSDTAHGYGLLLI